MQKLSITSFTLFLFMGLISLSRNQILMKKSESLHSSNLRNGFKDSQNDEILKIPVSYFVQNQQIGSSLYGCELKKIYKIYGDSAIQIWIKEIEWTLFADISDLAIKLNLSYSDTVNLSADCKAIKINDRIFHWKTDTLEYKQATLPWQSYKTPTYERTFKIAVFSNGFYKYQAETDKYELKKNGSYYARIKAFTFQDRVIIASYQKAQQQQKWNYKIQLYKDKIGKFQTIFEQGYKKFSTLIRPYQLVPQNCSKILITGLNGKGQINLLLRNFDWNAQKVYNLQYPINSPKKLYAAISDQYIYFRVFNWFDSGLYHAGYGYSKNKLVPIFYQDPIPISYDYGWIKTEIFQQNTDKLLLYHFLSLRQQQYLKDERKSLSEVIAERQDVLNNYIFQFTYPKLKKYDFLRRSQSDFKWSFLTAQENGTKITGIQFSEGEVDNRIKKQINLQGSYILLAQTLYCVLLQNLKSGLLEMHSFLQEPSYVEDLNAYMNQNLQFSKIKLGSQCQGFKIRNQIFRQEIGNSNQKFQKIQFGSQENPTEFDESLSFAVSGSKLYKYNQKDKYEEIVQSQFYETNIIKVSQGKEKIIVLSYKLGREVKFYLRYFVKRTDKWVEISLKLASISYFILPLLRVSDDFSSVGIGYLNQSQSPIILARKIDQYNEYQVHQIQIPQDSFKIDVWPHIEISNRYLYYRQIVTDPQKQYYEGLLVLDNETWKMTEVDKKKIQKNQSEIFKKSKIIQNENGVFVLYETEDSERNIKIRKEEFDSDKKRKMRSSINIKSTGVMVKDGKLFSCMPGCQQCSTLMNCDTCAVGFIASERKCIKCASSCNTCNKNNPDECLSCTPGMYLTGNTCQKCDSGCKKCQSSAATCIECEVSKFISSSKCQSCSENCLSCSSKLVCTLCRPGFTQAENGTCIQCLSGCSKCSSENLKECEYCTEHRFLDTSESPSTCKDCPINCKYCISASECSECMVGFILSSAETGKCVAACNYPCLTCDSSDSSKCFSCMEGHKIDLRTNKTCKADFKVACNQKGTCQSCPLNYFFFGGLCMKCTYQDQNCLRCLSENTDSCVECDHRYYLDSQSKCMKCPEECSTCQSDTLCYQCSQGFFLSRNSTQGRCLACEYPCETCWGSSNTCLSCKEGYSLPNGFWKCQKNTRVAYKIIVTGDQSALTTGQIVKFIKDIVEAAGKTSNEHNLDSIKSSSIIFQGNIEAEGQQDKEVVSEKLDEKFAKGKTIAGFPIESSRFTAGSNGNDERGNVILAIALGVAIPVALIITGIVIFFLYKKQKICNIKSQQPKEVNNHIATSRALRTD